MFLDLQFMENQGILLNVTVNNHIQASYSHRFPIFFGLFLHPFIIFCWIDEHWTH